MNKFSVQKLAKLAGVSVRTLHYYDKIGLLQPAERTEAKYRYYGEGELLRLQQILLYRELDFPLQQIAELLDAPDFDLLKALQEHKAELKRRKRRIDQILHSINHTIDHLKNKETKMDYDEMYKGLNREQAEAWRKEASERWGANTIDKADKQALAMSKEQWAALQQKGEQINEELAKLMDKQPNSEAVQQLIKEHYALMHNYFDVSPQAYRGLSDLYVSDERFSAYYDKYRKGLAVFLQQAMHAYCDTLKQ